jgi:HPt (histidine-containing phosphotransfer) domain-containing protein
MEREPADHEVTDRLDEELTRLRSAFVAKLPGRIQKLTDEWNGLQGDGWSEIGAHAFHRAIHGMIGTSGSLGFSEIAKDARQLERRLVTLVECPRAPSREIADEIVERLRQIGGHAAVEVL